MAQVSLFEAWDFAFLPTGPKIEARIEAWATQ
jgi:hypothetical protein